MDTFSGIAAADALDALNTADDFEPASDVDTIALDATYEALAAARALVARLAGLQKHLIDGGDADTTAGLKLDVQIALEAVAAITAAGIA